MDLAVRVDRTEGERLARELGVGALRTGDRALHLTDQPIREGAPAEQVARALGHLGPGVLVDAVRVAQRRRDLAEQRVVGGEVEVVVGEDHIGPGGGDVLEGRSGAGVDQFGVRLRLHPGGHATVEQGVSRGEHQVDAERDGDVGVAQVAGGGHSPRRRLEDRGAECAGHAGREALHGRAGRRAGAGPGAAGEHQTSTEGSGEESATGQRRRRGGQGACAHRHDSSRSTQFC